MLEEQANAKVQAKAKAEEEKRAKIVVAASKEDWKVGEKCLAFWWEDRKFYPAKVRQVSKKKENRRICVTFTQYGNSVILEASQLLMEGATPTKEQRQSAYYLHVEQTKAKKAAAAEKREKLKKEKMRKRNARR